MFLSGLLLERLRVDLGGLPDLLGFFTRVLLGLRGTIICPPLFKINFYIDIENIITHSYSIIRNSQKITIAHV